MSATPKLKCKRHFSSDVLSLVSSRGELTTLEFAKGQGIIAPGDFADAIFQIVKSKVKLTVSSRAGGEAVIGLKTRLDEDLADQLLNSSEKRLARLLLLRANSDRDGTPVPVVPRVSHETLAQMIGTTRSRVSFFMNRFRKSGLIEYDGC